MSRRADTSSARPWSENATLETHHIDVIPARARHGKPWQQFAFWWGINVNVFNLVLGAVVVEIGLSFWWALIAIGVGTAVGALLIGLHATQGPVLGVPQTIQSRGQFGFYGAAFLFPCVLLLNVGFIAAQLVIQAQSLQGVAGSLSIPAWIGILVIPAVIIGIFGYRWIHRVMQVTAVLVGVSLVIMFVQGLEYGSLPAHETSLASPSAGLFLAGVALLVIDMLSFGPFVSDYSRYLPADTSAAAAVLVHLRRQRAGHVHRVRDRRLPGGAAARARTGRRGREGVGQVGAGDHGAVAGQLRHRERLHGRVPDAVVREHVAAAAAELDHPCGWSRSWSRWRSARSSPCSGTARSSPTCPTSSTCCWSSSSPGRRST